MIRLHLLCLCCLAQIAFCFAQAPYKNAALSPQKRTADLLKRMTLEEKVGQLLCPMGWEMYEKNGAEVGYSQKFRELLDAKHTGMFWAVFRADPWTKKTLENGLNPELAAKAANAMQRYAMEKTRLGIPLFFAEEAPHGHMAIGATVFPTGIGMASTWSVKTLEEAGAQIAKEVRLQGAQIAYAPVIDLAREPRWSRVEETYGEDPVLTGTLAAAFVNGTGAGQLRNPKAVVATLKAFTAYGVSEGGQNGGAATLGAQDLYANFLPPFRDAINGGALSLMTAYNAIDGIPNSANKNLLTGVLRNQWKFRGFVVSDLFAIDGLFSTHRTARSLEEAAIQAITAGTDVDLGANAYQTLTAAVKTGKLRLAVVDSAVARVLRLKFEMGLFENPYVDPAQAKAGTGNATGAAVALKAARESITLLKNKNNILPLQTNLKVAVIGPNADNMYNQLGDYTAPQEPGRITTVLEGVVQMLGEKNVTYVKGCSIRDTTNQEIEKAVEAARASDVVVMVVGGSSARDFKTSYIETGAAQANAAELSDMESGEGFDRATLDLMGKQQELLEAVHQTGKPMVVVYIAGRPLEMNWADRSADALLMAWYPGQEGGKAVADVLFGKYNPAGRLPVSVPRNTGQLPVYYNKKRPIGHDYVEMTAKPLYPFGYGLSYTRFEYTDLKTQRTGKNQFKVSFLLKNTGKADGDEVVQLYLNDEFASVVLPPKELKQFDRIFLKAGAEKFVTFNLGPKDFQLVNEKLSTVVESGSFNVLIGGSSEDIKLKGKIMVD